MAYVNYQFILSTLKKASLNSLHHFDLVLYRKLTPYCSFSKVNNFFEKAVNHFFRLHNNRLQIAINIDSFSSCNSSIFNHLTLI
jgi:hypothetical protein